MPRGGFRPGAGRKADPEKVKARDAANAAKAASREPHGYTAPDGRKTADAPKDWPFGRSAEVDAPPPETVEDKKSFDSPLEYWKHVLADPNASKSEKANAAFSMAPYVHAKIAPAAKKEAAKERSKQASGGKFSAGLAPVLAAANGKRV